MNAPIRDHLSSVHLQKIHSLRKIDLAILVFGFCLVPIRGH